MRGFPIFKINRQRLRKYIDRWIYVIAIAAPIMTIPQVLVIWTNKSAQDISLVTWSAFLVSACSWLAYAITQKDKPLIVNSALWIVMELLVILGKLIYG